MKKVFAFLPKPEGCFAVFTENDTGTYTFRFVEDLPTGTRNNIKVKEFAKNLWECREEEDEVIAVIVRPDNRAGDDLKTLTKVAYNVATVKAILDLENFRTYWINRAKNWQAFFNLLDLLPSSNNSIKTAAVNKLKDIYPELEVTRYQQAEAILIGIYGIYNILKSRVEGVKDGTGTNEQ